MLICKDCRKPETICKCGEPVVVTKVKKASEIVKWLEENGYEVNDDGDWYKPETRAAAFIHHMFIHCGEEPAECWVWFPEWLEET